MIRHHKRRALVSVCEALLGVCRPLLGVCGALVSVCVVWGSLECLRGTYVCTMSAVHVGSACRQCMSAVHVGRACLLGTRHCDFKRFCNKDVQHNSILLPVALRIENLVVSMIALCYGPEICGHKFVVFCIAVARVLNPLNVTLGFTLVQRVSYSNE